MVVFSDVSIAYLKVKEVRFGPQKSINFLVLNLSADISLSKINLAHFSSHYSKPNRLSQNSGYNQPWCLLVVMFASVVTVQFSKNPTL